MARFERFIIYPVLLFCLLYIANNINSTKAQGDEIHVDRLVANSISAAMIKAGDVTIQDELLAMGSIVTLKEYVLLNKEGKRILVLSVNAEEGGSLELFNQDGRRAADFSTFDRGGLVMLYNSQGQVILRLGQDLQGHGLIGVYNQEGATPAFYGHMGRE